MNTRPSDDAYDLAIIGGGVIGASLLYVASKYTNLSRMILLEKHGEPGMVNSNSRNNSQTLHFGEIETNYSLEKAKKVSAEARLVAAYARRNAPEAIRTIQKMVLAVGKTEVAELERRYEEFKTDFPYIRKLSRAEIARVEPNVVEGRDPREELAALFVPEGYAVDFGKLTASFIDRAAQAPAKTIETRFRASVAKISRIGGYWEIELRNDPNVIRAKAVVVATGPHSLIFAKSLGYGKAFGILPVAGNFYAAQNTLRGKVYMMQIKKMPFAAIHGDPDVTDPAMTRFGPTIRVLPLLERHDYRTVVDFVKTSAFGISGIWSLLSIISDPTILKYVLKNLIYDIPFLGKALFVRWELRKTVPALRPRDVRLDRGAGGIRPQVINIEKRAMEMGEVAIKGEHIIFNITPSPGASVCLGNAKRNAQEVIRFLGKDFSFDEAAFRQDLEQPF
jgi:malate dehydrogenase (quinone)